MSKAEKNVVKNGIVFTGKSWSYVLRVPDVATGKTKPKWVGGYPTEKAAKLARDTARLALAKNDYVMPGKLSVGEFLQSWIHNHSKHLKPITTHKYQQLIRLYLIPKLGNIRVQDLRPIHIQNFYTELLSTPGAMGKPLSNRTVEQCGAILKVALKNAVEVEGILSFNPAARVRLPKKISITSSPWTIDELNQFLQIIESHRLSFYFRLSAFTGARRGELLALKWSDFDGHSITISKSRINVGGKTIEQNTTKGGVNGQRRVSLDSETIGLFNSHRKRQVEERLVLGEYWQNTGYVFVQESGLPLDPGTPTHLFNKIQKQFNLRHTRLHDLRHLHATELLRLGEPLHVVANRLGHRDAMVTATIYAHVSNEQAETASARFLEATRLK